MNENFVLYLTSIGMTQDLIKRIDAIYEFYQQMCPDEITGIFVSEYVRDDGGREYENLWFFSEKYYMEAEQFITNDRFKITPIRNRVAQWRVVKKDYDFKKASGNSRLSVEFSIDFFEDGKLKASKENCDYLREVMTKYISSNIMDRA